MDYKSEMKALRDRLNEVVWLMPAWENWFSKRAEQLPVDCIRTDRPGPRPARKAEPLIGKSCRLIGLG